MEEETAVREVVQVLTEEVYRSPPPVEEPGRYPYRITIRMTRRERAVIGRKANDCDLSLSRFLVESATAETVLRSEDRGRLLRLKDYFDEAAQRLQAFSALPVFQDVQHQQPAQRLQEVLCVLESLSTELGKRLT